MSNTMELNGTSRYVTGIYQNSTKRAKILEKYKRKIRT